MPIFLALTRALRDLAQPRVLIVLLVPMLAAIVLWSLLGWFFWDTWITWFRTLIDGTAAARWLIAQGAGWVLSSLSVVLGVGLLLPAMLITAMIVTELVAMPVVVSVVARAYPALQRKRGGTVAGSVRNAMAAFVIFALLWLVTLPFWLTGVGAVVLPALNAAYLNQRLFRYDALSEHASREELRAIVGGAKVRLYALGFVLALLYYVPFVNLIAPVLSGLAFTHFGLAELARVRGLAPREGG